MRRNGGAPRADLAQEKHERETAKAKEPEQPEIFDKCPQAGLTEERVVEDFMGLHVTEDRAALGSEGMLQSR